MSTVITDLEPKSVWKHFSELNKIPRPSSHEQNAAKYIVDFANKNGFKVETDAVGNVIIDVPASADKKDAPTVILQGHMDMVPVAAEGYDFDFLNDPIQSYVDGDFVRAKNTTLGADNGIAIAMALALFEDKTLSHGPLRAIFTVEEETTMKGASNLDAKYLDATYLINLDSEENGFLYVNCAGSQDIDVRFNIAKIIPEATSALTIRLSNFSGGHSGCDIHVGNANAIKVMATIIDDLSDEYDLFIQDFTGGTVRNSIPAKASVTIAVPQEETEEIKKSISRIFETQKSLYAKTDPDMKLEITEATVAKALGYAQTQDLIHLLRALPSGIVRMSKEFAPVVETSINLSMVKTFEDEIVIEMMPRSLEDAGLAQIVEDVRSCCYLLDNVEVETKNLHHCWSSPSHNRLIDVLNQCYKEVTGNEFKITAMHAGVECAQFAILNKELQLISVGPTILNPHSPQERVDIRGVEQMYVTVCRALAML